MPLHVELVSPERVVLTTTASMVLVRTTDGDIAFQPGHVPFVGVLLPERVRIYGTDGTTQLIAVHSGFVEVAADRVAILSDVAELAGDIDTDRATAAAERARAAPGGPIPTTTRPPAALQAGRGSFGRGRRYGDLDGRRQRAGRAGGGGCGMMKGTA